MPMVFDDATVHRALASPARAAILRVLRDAKGPLGAGQIAAPVGLSANSVRLHLAVLVEAGLVTVERRPASGRGRPAALYRAMAEPAAAGGRDAPEEYRLLAEILAGCLASTEVQGRDQAADAGERWGHYLADRPAPFEPVSAADAGERVTALFRRLHFSPELEMEADGARILIRHCPFRRVAEKHPSVACSVHLGLLRGALEAARAPLRVVGLDPFVEPQLCVARLATAPAAMDC
jgi:predicted ArsR family transcriptional regulator